jgi:hypothetical protein
MDLPKVISNDAIDIQDGGSTATPKTNVRPSAEHPYRSKSAVVTVTVDLDSNTGEPVQLGRFQLIALKHVDSVALSIWIKGSTVLVPIDSVSKQYYLGLLYSYKYNNDVV